MCSICPFFFYSNIWSTRACKQSPFCYVVLPLSWPDSLCLTPGGSLVEKAEGLESERARVNPGCIIYSSFMWSWVYLDLSIFLCKVGQIIHAMHGCCMKCCCCSFAKSHVCLFASHGLQHTRLPCPSLSPGVCSSLCPLSRGCYLVISSSVALFSSCPQSFPTSGSFPKSHLFASSD